MTLSGDFVYLIAYCIFLIGAANSFQNNVPQSSIWTMSVAVVIDFLGSVLPVMRVKSLAIDLPGNPAITVAIFLGILVWLLFLFALFIWKIKKIRLFHFIILSIEVIWFIDYVLLLYGVYKVPLR
ncbi:MAG: hypothetical protein NTV89_15060 [Proteobacteria bacterium]|nr:hypothetical protein [Pseudomonadota bacterium]